jgi:hypothetical protein
MRKWRKKCGPCTVAEMKKNKVFNEPTPRHARGFLCLKFAIPSITHRLTPPVARSGGVLAAPRITHCVCTKKRLRGLPIKPLRHP